MARVTVTSTSNKFTQRIEAGSNDEFKFATDEPLDVGGDNLGPTPYDLLLGALGSCMSMTMLLYARKKRWPLEKVSVDLGHQRIHAKDCEGDEAKAIMLDHISVKVTLDGPLDPEQRQKIMEIGRKCPIHNTLTHEVIIDLA